MTALQTNPFVILGATTRDDRRRLIELADARALEGDQEQIQKARATLTNPKSRLLSELSWLPGVSPKRASQLLEILEKAPGSLKNINGLPPLASANLLAASIEKSGPIVVDELTIVATKLASALEGLDLATIFRDINEDRVVSGFSPVPVVDALEEGLAERKRHYNQVLRTALDRLPSRALVAAVTKIVDQATDSGSKHAPVLIDDLVDSYSLDAQEFLTVEASNVRQLLEVIENSAPAGESEIRPLIAELGRVVRNWDLVAQPVQLSAKARGTVDEVSRGLAIDIRSTGIDLFNKHNLLESAKQVTDLLQEVFAEVPEVFERLEQDASAIEDIVTSRAEAEEQQREFAASITYEAEIGLVFKTKFRMSPDGIEWDGTKRSLESITRVRWGGVRHSVNGIPTGTTYTIAFGDSRSETSLELRNEEIYTEIVGRLWPAVCARLALQVVQILQDGKSLSIGSASFRDDGVDLVKRKLFGAHETVRCVWRDLQIWTADGAFYIGAKADKKTYAQLSYLDVPNVHIIEFLVQKFFDKGGARLSDVFKG